MITIPLLAAAAAAMIAAAGGAILGRNQGHRVALDQIVTGLEIGEQVLVKDKVIVGYAMSTSEWFKNPIWSHDTKPAQTDTISGHTECELAYVKATAKEGIPMPPMKNVRLAADIDHAREVKIYGTYRAPHMVRKPYNHPFLTPRSIG